MPRKPATPKIPKREAKVMKAVANAGKADKSIENNLMGGWGGNPQNLQMFSPYGLPGSPNGAGSIQQLSDTTTIFTNLRWYFLSNFRQVLSQIYCEIGLIERIVSVPVDDAFRGGVIFKSKQLGEDDIKALQMEMDRDDDLGTIETALRWTRLFGGGGIVILVEDQDPETPFDIDAITDKSDITLIPVDLWELYPNVQDAESNGVSPWMEDAGEFEYYNYYSKRLHKSRVMKMKGPEAPSFVRPRLRGWGFSVLEPLVRPLNQYLKTSDLIFEVIDEFKIDVYKIKGYVNTMLGAQGASQVRRRIQDANLLKNFQHALVMDSEDDWDHKQLDFGGLSDAQLGNRKQLAAETGIPITKLFGSSDSGAGIGTADQNDMENYNSLVESQVRKKGRLDTLRIGQIKCQKLFGYIPDDLELEFKPLRVLSAEQEENVKTQKFTRLIQAKQLGEITTLEFRDSCNKGNLFDTKLDTSEDALNPDDPEIDAVVAEEGKKPGDEDSVDPGDKPDSPVPPTESKKTNSLWSRFKPKRQGS